MILLKALFAGLLLSMLAQPSHAYTPTNALNNTQLQGMATITYPGGVCRATYGNGNGASTLCYQPSNSPCSLNSGNGDNGSQVKSADGKCWIAQFPAGIVDVLQFGAINTGSGDNTAIFNAAAVAAGGGIVVVPPGTYNLSATPTYGSSGWQYQPGATTTGAPVTSTVGGHYPLAVTKKLNSNQFGNPNDWLNQYGYGDGANTPLWALSQVGGAAIVGASRNTDNGGGTAAAIGVLGWNFNFNTTTPAPGWGVYTEARHISGAGSTTTIEMDATQLGSGTVDINPYNFAAGLNASAWIASGGGCGVAGYTCYNGTTTASPFPASTGIGILDNGAKFRTGITVKSTALDSTATTLSSNGRFAALPSGAGIEWSSNSSTTIGSLSADGTVGGPGLLWTGNTPRFSFKGTEGTAKSYSISENAGALFFQDETDNLPTFNFGSGSTTFVSMTPTQFFSGVQIIAGFLATSGGGGGLYVCVDTTGLLYKKASCP